MFSWGKKVNNWTRTMYAKKSEEEKWWSKTIIMILKMIVF